MINDHELALLLSDIESDRVERKESLSDRDRVREAICAFANDMPGHGESGVIFIGAKDDGSCAGLAITDELLRSLADMRDDGNILPMPSMTVQKRTIAGCEMAVVTVHPSLYPPVRFKGRIWIRVGPRRAIASSEEEQRLNERRRAHDLPSDLRPIASASLDDLDLDLFERTYLPAAFPSEVLEENDRTIEQRLTTLRFLSSGDPQSPTVSGLLAIGKSPADHVPGAYVQFLRIEGAELSDPIADQKDCHGPLPELLPMLDDIMSANIRVATDITSEAVEQRRPNYPLAALQQLVRNAVMHRDYATSNAPTRVTWFVDRVEIQNPGGPYGQVTAENFGQPGVTDYRNPNVAEAMKTLGFVQRFGVGIAIARRQLADNGNPPPDFQVQPNHVLAIVRSRS